MATSTHLRKFDPGEHPGSVYEVFCDFIVAFKYEYEAIAKDPPAGEADAEAWKEQNRRRQLMGRFASRNLQRDFENEVAESERSTITFKDTVHRLKERYKPTRNTVYANFQFRKLAQRSEESFDTFATRVKQEAGGCEFSCGDTCTVPNVMIRDQILVGSHDDEIRKTAMKNQ